MQLVLSVKLIFCLCVILLVNKLLHVSSHEINSIDNDKDNSMEFQDYFLLRKFLNSGNYYPLDVSSNARRKQKRLVKMARIGSKLTNEEKQVIEDMIRKKLIEPLKRFHLSRANYRYYFGKFFRKLKFGVIFKSVFRVLRYG